MFLDLKIDQMYEVNITKTGKSKRPLQTGRRSACTWNGQGLPSAELNYQPSETSCFNGAHFEDAALATGDPDAALPASALCIGFCAYLTLNTIAAQVCLQAIPRRTVNRRWSGRD